MASVLIGEHDSLTREGMRSLLRERFRVVGAAEDGRALMDAAEQTRPDIVLIDVLLPNSNGVEAARRIHRIVPQAKVVFVGPNDRSPWAREAIEAGCAAYIPRDNSADELVPVLETVMRGDKSFPACSEEEGLSERQTEILRLIAEGRCSKEIATQLHLSVKTIEFHRGQLIRKLGMKSVADMTRFALQVGLVTPNN